MNMFIKIPRIIYQHEYHYDWCGYNQYSNVTNQYIMVI